ncbi:MAG: hypothetical protein HYU69_02490 [Bacteroidetes bacterium]|nr:hypothetical protein [Bacteroidota bacterium]
MKTLKLLTFFVSISLLITSCTKPKDGAAGTNGTNGINGNANVKSTIFTVTTWSNFPKYYYVYINDPNITAAIMDSGAIEVFWSIDNGTTWNPTPWPTNSTGYVLVQQASLGKVTVYWTHSSGALNQDFNTYWAVSSCKFKVVCIAASAMKQHPTTNWHNYAEAQKALGFD